MPLSLGQQVKDAHFAIVEIRYVDITKSTCRGTIRTATKGMTGFPEVIQLTYPGYSYLSGSGIMRIPKPKDYCLVIHFKGNFLPIVFFSPPIVKGNTKESSDVKPVEKGKTPLYTYDNEKEGPNFSAGRLELKEGSCAMLGEKGESGVIVYPKNKILAYASEMCQRTYEGDYSKPDQIAKIFDRTIEYILESTSYELECTRSVRKNVEQDGASPNTNKTKTSQRFYKEVGNAGKKNKKDKKGKTKSIFYEILTGSLEDSKGNTNSGSEKDKALRISAVREPDEQGDKKTKLNKDTSTESGAQSKFKKYKETIEPKDISPDHAGRQNPSRSVKVELEDGSIVWGSIKEIEFHGREKFLVFVEKDNAADGANIDGSLVTDPKVGMLTDGDILIHTKGEGEAEKNIEISTLTGTCDIIGKKKASISNENVEAFIENDKFIVKKKGSSSSGGNPTDA